VTKLNRFTHSQLKIISSPFSAPQFFNEIEKSWCGEWDADARIDVKKGFGEFSYNPL